MGGVLRVTADVEAGGPIFDGSADAAIEQWAHDVVTELADLGVRDLKAFPMDKSGRATGAFSERLHAVVNGPVARIQGPQIRGVVWSPWLEGSSQRNSSTGFGGYHLFAKTARGLRQKMLEVGQRHAERLVEELGGS